MRTSAHLSLLIACLVGFGSAGAGLSAPGRTPPTAAAPDFNRDIRPILTGFCFKCHGPDDAQRQAGLRLDERSAGLAVLPTGRRALIPGRAETSELVRRVFAPAGSGREMPPAHVRNPLSEAQKQLLRQWVRTGAKYDIHWAFLPPRAVVLPPVRNNSWSRNPIDRFVLSRLEREGLAPTPEADRATLARRVFLDLIGLPPTPEEAAAFVNDRTADAYEKLVDRLLSSPRYGERWARRWLDLARYADTNGYEKDRPRSVWPYRDWVIRALNRDQPFDQFTIEQLAGDMLPYPTRDQVLATGFHRNTMLNEEGGIDPLEYRFHAMTDRVSVTATTWMGVTLGCAQCHSHKYDPLSQKDYYRFFAYLNNADEPEVEVEQADPDGKRREGMQRIAALEAGLAGRFPAADGRTQAENLELRYRAWLTEQERKTVRWLPLRPTAARANLPLLTIQPDGSLLASGDQTKRDVYDLEFGPEAGAVTAVRIEAIPDERLPKRGPGRVYYEGPHGDFFLSEISLLSRGQPAAWSGASHSFAVGTGAPGAIDGNQQTGWSVNGGQGKPHQAVFTLARPLDPGSAFTLRLLFERYYAAGLGHFRVSATTDGRPVQASPLAPELEAALLLPEGGRTSAQTTALRQAFLAQAPELKTARDEIEKLRAELPQPTTALVFQERPLTNPRPTHIHRRGEFLQPTERVEPGLLASLAPPAGAAPRTRLEFARWLASPANPLIGRVTVNRQWAAFFGRGLVRTTEDFGVQGDPPSHPELLDWLATAFVSRSGANQGARSNSALQLDWSLKRLHRLIVTSAAYRQASRVTPMLAARDPQNRLLARGPRVRLEAELVRDAALQVSSLLSAKGGGPSVFPPQPAGVTAEGTFGALQWKVSEGEDRYRRGLYTFAKRTAPYAMFATFDGPSGEACVARRESSNTPLQALTLLNDAVFVEAARALGQQAAAQNGPDEERAESLFRRVLTRAPTPDERALLVRFVQAQRERLRQGTLNAGALVGAGEGDGVERAAWAAAARSLLNLDEWIVKS